MLRNPFMIKNSAGVATISLAPKTGESILVKDIHCTPAVGVAEFLTIQVGRQTVGFIHTGTTIFNQLPYKTDDSVIETIFTQMGKRGYDMSIPIAEGETLTLTAPTAWTRLTIEYEVFDAGDQTSDKPNGSQSEEYILLNYGTNLATIATIGYHELTGVKNPVEFPNFPFGASVPSRCEMEILGIGMCDVTRAGAAFGTDDLRSTYIRLYRDREVLFDDDRNGFIVAGLALGGTVNTTTYYGLGVTSCPYGGAGTYKDIKLFPEPIKFSGNEELTVEVCYALSAGGGTLAIGDVVVCVPIRVKKVA